MVWLCDRTSESHWYVSSTHNPDPKQCDVESCQNIDYSTGLHTVTLIANEFCPSPATESEPQWTFAVQPVETLQLKTQFIHVQTADLQKL